MQKNNLTILAAIVKMRKLLFFILSFGFMVQCTGLENYAEKAVEKIEKSTADKENNEEDNKGEFKIIKDQLNHTAKYQVHLNSGVYKFQAGINYKSSEFSNTPYLPPRQS